MTLPRTSLVLGLFAAAALAAPALADPNGFGEMQQVSRTVHVGDVDLHTTDGARVAARRIKNAASDVCGGDSRPILMVSDFAACRNDAIDRALASIDAPLVSAALGRSPQANLAAR
jgi:UrcA family protein